MPNNVVHNPEEEKCWEKAKAKVKEEYPDVKEGDDNFYKITMSIYKNMTKSASGEDIIANLKVEGVLSKNAADKYYEDHQFIQIVSKLFGSDQEKVADDYLKDVGKGILTGGALALTGAGAVGASKGIQRFIARKHRAKRLNDIIKFSPIIGEMDPMLVNEGMKTLEDYNPEMAKHPLIAGSFLKSIHNYGGVTPEQANILQGQNRENNLSELFQRSAESVSKYDTNNFFDSRKKLHKKNLTYDKNNTVKEAKYETVKDLGKSMLIAGSAVAGLSGAGALGSKLYNRLTRRKRLENVQDFSPELKNADPKFLNAGMKSLERLNPQVSKDPLAAAGFLKEIIKKKELNTNILKNIVDTSNKSESENSFVTAAKILGKDLK